MIYKGTFLDIADNSGARLAQCIGICGSSKKSFSRVGELVVIVIKSAIPSSKIKKGSISKGLVVRTKYPIYRSDGSVLRFDKNAVVLMSENGDMVGSRVFGSIPREIRFKNYMQIVSLAKEVL